MSASKYLPPFTTEERGAAAAGRTAVAQADAGVTLPAPEVTYADFLGDEVDEADQAG
jgi:hypothetical protein